jgi:hypothetical protein
MKLWFPTNEACETYGMPSFEGYHFLENALNDYPLTSPHNWVHEDAENVEDHTVMDGPAPKRPLESLYVITVYWLRGEPESFYCLNSETSDFFTAVERGQSREGYPSAYLNPVTTRYATECVADTAHPEPLNPFDVLIPLQNIRNIRGGTVKGVCYDPNTRMLVKVDKDENIVEPSR